MNLIEAIVMNADLIDKPECEAARWARQKRIEDALPSGSGFDSCTQIESVTHHRVVFKTAFHHMDDGGFYDGWTEHRVTAEADLALGFTVRVSGKNRNGIKDYIADTFYAYLQEPFEWLPAEEKAA